MKKDKYWKIKYDVPDTPVELVDAGFTPLLATILYLRGYTDIRKAKVLIEGKSDCIHDARLIMGMDKAAIRVKKAIQNREKIAVYGDYDVDGITSTALLTDYLKGRGVDVTPYIPDRNEEGYGLNTDALRQFKDDGISLVITVDCGITSKEEAEFARQLGLDLVVTDHHECKDETLPDCCAIIDCKQPGDTYPNPNLAGVGMAFKLVCAVDGNTNTILNKYCDLLAIGTVADVMPLIDENRIFVKYGLSKLKTNPRIGIKAIMNEAEMNLDNLTASSISYILAPRLNAAGRLGNAIMAEKLILSQDEGEATVYAAELCELNKKRQSIENDIWQQAFDLLKDHDTTKPIVMANDKWNPGVIGIAASRLAEYFGVPAIMIYTSGNVGKGSCRSYGGFNLFEALNYCSKHLISYGGHALAAGLNIEKDKIGAFTEELRDYYSSHTPEAPPELECDLLITDPELLSNENVESLDLLEPYGNSNPKPIFCMLGVLLEQSVSVGSGKHLKMRVSSNGHTFDCIFFSTSSSELGIRSGDYIDIAFTPQINEYHGQTNVQLVLTAARRHDATVLCDDINGSFNYKKAIRQFVPDRKDFIRLWKTSGSELSSRPVDMVAEKYQICRKVFEEVGLIDRNGVIINSQGKKDLENAPTLKALNEQR